jgi:excisionase family DNA binding protein
MKMSPRRKTSPKPRIVDIREAAEFLHIDQMTLFMMLRRGEIPGAFKVGLAWRVDLGELEASKRFLKTNSRRAQ